MKKKVLLQSLAIIILLILSVFTFININSYKQTSEPNIKAVEPAGCQCSGERKPICGKDGHTYINLCEAECDQAEILYQGECKKYQKNLPVPDNCAECDILSCPEDTFVYLDATGCPVCECSEGTDL